LLQAHFSRIPLASAVESDQMKVLPDATRLLQAMVDVISSSGWLAPALATMELSQMVTQGMWNTDSPLLQLPHMDADLVKKCQAAGVASVPDLIDMDDAERNRLLSLKPAHLQAIARACNNYPDVDVKFKVEKADDVHAGGRVVVCVDLERDPDSDEPDNKGVPKVSAPRYPQIKTEGWWLVIGNPSKNELTSIKRIAMKKKTMQVKMDFSAPEVGKYKYQLFLMSDSYMGCDQEYELNLEVREGSAKPAADSSSDEDGDD